MQLRLTEKEDKNGYEILVHIHQSVKIHVPLDWIIHSAWPYFVQQQGLERNQETKWPLVSESSGKADRVLDMKAYDELDV